MRSSRCSWASIVSVPERRKDQKLKASAKRKPRAKTTVGPGKRGEGKRLSAARQSYRDSLILARRAQGWPWDAIAHEAKLSVTATEEAAARRRAEAPLTLRSDPVELVESTMGAVQAAIGDFEEMALRYRDRSPNAAVGAKKAALEAHFSLMALLQAIGRLPEDLTALRHVTEQRALAVRMLDAIERFETQTRSLAASLEPEEQARHGAAVADVKCVFHEMIGLPEEPDIANGCALPAPLSGSEA